ncbi:hypothetical protein [Algibacter sp. L3A6]|uniref:hypothetical protein n=1 Tax=Algibacter sp. L3A6 TaxID=2686366 RepID=UPI00131B0605|nr:hypothetical protein [Algibacter sp. L3A6]
MAQADLNERAKNLTKENIVKIDTEINLTDDEKATYPDFSNAYYLEHFTIVQKYKTDNPELFKEKVIENNNIFIAKLKKAYGNKRANEILKARRSK